MKKSISTLFVFINNNFYRLKLNLKIHLNELMKQIRFIRIQLKIN